VIELARLFHDWYEKHPIMSEDDVHKRTGRITLVSHYEQVMRGTLSLIGITPQERM
jgi:arginyl-tRNA synthetase